MSSALPSDLPDSNRFRNHPLRTAIEQPVRLLGFWTAVLLPFVLLALVAVGIAQQSPQVFAALVTANVAGLVLGKDYKQ